MAATALHRSALLRARSSSRAPHPDDMPCQRDCKNLRSAPQPHLYKKGYGKDCFVRYHRGGHNGQLRQDEHQKHTLGYARQKIQGAHHAPFAQHADRHIACRKCQRPRRLRRVHSRNGRAQRGRHCRTLRNLPARLFAYNGHMRPAPGNF